MCKILSVLVLLVGLVGGCAAAKCCDCSCACQNCDCQTCAGHSKCCDSCVCAK